MDRSQQLSAPAVQRTLQPLPQQIAQSRASECLPTLVGCGARMEIYPLVDERTVLRVPRRTEQQLINASGSSGRTVLSRGHQISKVTEGELRDLEKAHSYIGAFLPDTTPFPDLDLQNEFRYYSLQRRVRIRQDLRICTDQVPADSLQSLERFVRDVRDMMNAHSLMPDLAGKGNLVLDESGRVQLIDINNFRHLVPTEEVEKGFPSEEEELEEYVLGRRDIRAVLPRGFLDDLGNPIGDLSLAALQTLEIRGLGRSADELEKDPFYEPLRNECRRLALALLRADLA